MNVSEHPLTVDAAPMRVLTAVFVYNEGERLRSVLREFPQSRNYDIVVMDDGSTDRAEEIVREFPFAYLRHDINRGAGAAIRTVIEFALEKKYDVLILIAGNGKMIPSDIPGVLQPILDGGYDLVQGSRYLKGGRSENLPLFRRIMIPLFTWCVRLTTGHRTTDVTCGFRAIRLDIFNHPTVNIAQSWLERYEMEYYILYKAIKLGYRMIDVPVSMVYPAEKTNYSKIRPFVGWWSMIRPWIFLTLRVKK